MDFKVTSDYILYLHDYYPVRSEKHDLLSKMILSFKDGNDFAIKQFAVEMCEAMRQRYSDGQLDLKNTIICIMPAHEASEYSKGLVEVADHIISYFGMIDGRYLIRRVHAHEKVSKGGNRSIRNQLDSLEINQEYQITGKDIIVLDDITTTGNSISAAIALLKRNHAGRVFAQTIGKTQSEYEQKPTFMDLKEVYEDSYYAEVNDNKPNINDATAILKRVFGYDSFRTGQERIISDILAGKDVIAIMPTGSGKSICYQVPALTLPGITIVISPLISLMQDQVKALNEAGVHAGYVNSTLTEGQINLVYRNAAAGTYKILYVAPERLESDGFISFSEKADISMVTVDEAHCISQWGQDFRPSYLKIVQFIDRLPKRPIVSAFTATATEEVKTDIVCVLKMNNPDEVSIGFDRENLFFVVESVSKKDDYVIDYIRKHPNDSGIIYCATRKNVDNLYNLLLERGLPVARYHAGMGNTERKESQDDFIYDRKPIIIATNAFGMGIDKSNVRYVIHYNMPQSMENYYQEAGRAGRDGEPAECILLFAPKDVMINRNLINNKDFTDVQYEDIDLIMQRDMRRLHIMEAYCKTTDCLRNYILNYFGDKTDGPCENCGNCQREYTVTDRTSEAKQIINCVYESRGKYGLNIIIGTVLGLNRARMRETGTVNYKTYACLKGYPEDDVRDIIDQMLLEGYLIQTDERYSVLKLGDISPLKDENTKLYIREYKGKEEKATSKAKTRKKKTDSLTKAGYELFERLRVLRLELAREAGLPPYIIFSDKTLIDMCVRLPMKKEEMLKVSGVGEVKFERYGEQFIDEIAEFLEDNPEMVITMTDDDESGETVKVTTPVKKKTKPDNVGAAWTPEEDEQLKEEFESGLTMTEIAKIHGRTRGGIRARLKRHGLVE